MTKFATFFASCAKYSALGAFETHSNSQNQTSDVIIQASEVANAFRFTRKPLKRSDTCPQIAIFGTES